MQKQNPKFPEHINASQEPPLKEFLVLVLGIVLAIILCVGIVSYFAQALSPYIPFSWEKSWLPNDVTQFTQDEEPSTHIEQQVEQALNDLLASLSQVDTTTDVSYDIHLLKDNTPNAFATLGGNIFVTTGLIKHIQSENGLAMVIAHEMAHVQYRHPIQALSRGLIIQLVGMMIFSDSAASSILNQTSLLTLLSFNREMEREADRAAISMLNNHYGHSAGADEFFSTMIKMRDYDLSMEFFNTHPNTEKRLDAIRLSQKYKGVLTPLNDAFIILQNEGN